MSEGRYSTRTTHSPIWSRNGGFAMHCRWPLDESAIRTSCPHWPHLAAAKAMYDDAALLAPEKLAPDVSGTTPASP